MTRPINSHQIDASRSELHVSDHGHADLSAQLILFDIDATLITTGGVGLLAMQDAGRELFGTFEIAGLDFAGRLDPALIGEMFALNGIDVTDTTRIPFCALYQQRLAWHLERCEVKRALPGVMDLLSALRGRAGVTLGLLTGNFEESGIRKIRACGIDSEQFEVAAWGDDSPHTPPDRAHLPPVAMQRYAKRFSREIHPSRVTIIGDTQHDVRCAKVSGCRSIAVATGRATLDDLRAHSPDLALQNLAETDRIVKWLGVQ